MTSSRKKDCPNGVLSVSMERPRRCLTQSLKKETFLRTVKVVYREVGDVGEEEDR